MQRCIAERQKALALAVSFCYNDIIKNPNLMKTNSTKALLAGLVSLALVAAVTPLPFDDFVVAMDPVAAPPAIPGPPLTPPVTVPDPAAAVPPAGGPATGGGGLQNCTVDLTTDVPDAVDWRSVFLVRGADGSAWQRAIISNGGNGSFALREFEPTLIYGTAAPHTDVQVYFWTPQENPNGGLLKPAGPGTCFTADTRWMTEEGAQARIESGYFEFPVQSQILWPNLGDDIVLDAFFRLEKTWDEIAEDTRYRGAQNYYFATHIAPRELQVGGEFDRADCTRVCDQGPALSVTLDPSKLSETFRGNNFDEVDMATVVIGRQPGIHTFYAGRNAGATNTEQQGAMREITHKSLAMEILKRALLANEHYPAPPPGLESISVATIEGAARGTVQVSPDIQTLLRSIAVVMINGGAPVGGTTPVGAAAAAAGTAPVGSTVPPPTTVPQSVTDASSGFSYFPELGTEPLNAPNQLDNILPPAPVLPGAPGAAAPVPGAVQPSPSPVPIQTERPAFVPAVPNPPVPPPPGVSFLAGTDPAAGRTLLGALLNRSQNPQLLDELFQPGSSTEDTWASNLVTLISFWTGSLEPNLCLMADDRFVLENFQDNRPMPAFQCDDTMQYVSGVTPLLLLHSDEPMRLQPAFRDAIITEAAVEFDGDEYWDLPAGEKTPLGYHYAFGNEFPADRIAEACVQRVQFPQLIASIAAELGLRSEEAAVLAQELAAVAPATEQFLQLRFADPADVAARLQWLGNGDPLDIFQLFFELEEGACDAKRLPQFDILPPPQRDGFEAGLLKS